MPKPQKIEAVKELKERLQNADAALLAEYRGLKVQEMKEVRRTLASGGTDLKVVKNTLSKIAATEAKLEDLIPLLQGSTAIAFIQGDPVAAAKGLDDMAKKYPALVIKGGMLDGKVFGPDQAQALAKIEPREVLLAKLAGMLQAPLQSVANLLSAPLRQLGYVLGAYQEKLQQEAPAEPVAESAQSEAEKGAETAQAETGPEQAEAATPQAEAETPQAEAETAAASNEAEPQAASSPGASDEVAAEPPAAASEAVAETSGEEAAPEAPSAPEESGEPSGAAEQAANENDQQS